MLSKRSLGMALGVFLLGAVVTVAMSSVPFFLTAVACTRSANAPAVPPQCQAAVDKFAVVPLVLSAVTVGGTVWILVAHRRIVTVVASALAGGGLAALFVGLYWFNQYPT
ncbi:hypothetical protein CU254_38955 [Amycolatopsis sp. AA4]|uniref:hypothetical protein n=1 Tax=Actinomycetes TaxID=1760 RepID=UPI0001DEE9EC|nr:MULTISPECIES: hypothetical protein [Actinomycetes]ATY15706.1 hypothetical protein CU254_38955 [Amycolatopsis sp. AA4]EFL12003.1 predicted protein [Streptomyces sp. AA4]